MEGGVPKIYLSSEISSGGTPSSFHFTFQKLDALLKSVSFQIYFGILKDLAIRSNTGAFRSKSTGPVHSTI